MKKIKNIFWVLVLVIVIIGTHSCQQPSGENTGSEYMPDMAHSIAYEANTYAYYYNNTWGSKEDYYEWAKPRKPVPGTIARGAASSPDTMRTMNQIRITPNGAKPYYYEDTEEGRAQATAELIDNPFPITDEGLARGQELYDIFCGICHGGAGGGQGYLVREANPAIGDEGGKYPVQPANFLLEEFIEASNGRYYHAIEYGKNLMGSYKDKLSYEERWQVIHYIRSLQAKSLKLKYDQYENTLNTIDIPAGDIVSVINNQVMELGDGKFEPEDHNPANHDGINQKYPGEDADGDHDDDRLERNDNGNHGGDH
ncbi:c-type cytochrome [Portibacter marinus]|uniref:c-type cytochrome n=1 Tax=Portibacter marinus TaxID=2898660 RepID=UPI001F339124|nr:cytochrome c [Portibacter marinus]